MKDQSPSDFGKQLGQLVQDAVQSGDYSQLKSAMSVTAQEIKQTIHTAADSWTQNASQTFQRNVSQPVRTPPPPRRQRAPKRQPVYPRPPAYARPPVPQPPVYNGVVINRKKIPGSAAGPLLLVFGILGLIPAVITTLALLPSLFFSGEWLGAIIAAAVCLPIDFSFLAMIASGSSIRGRVNRFRRYTMIMQGARYFSLEQLASASGVSKNFLVKDLRRMIRKGMFSFAYIDDQETCIILEQTAYQQYLETKQHLEQQRLQAEREKQLSSQAPPSSAPADGAAAAIAEGRNYIRQIKAANDAIPNEEISSKLYRLEAVATKVFAYVELHPEKLPEIRKFMNYYLPTTLKLVNAYREFDAQPIDGANISTAKKEIQDILDTINSAFENLLDSLFEDDAMDISTDISALNIMLAQDGLTGSDFKSGK